MKKKPILHPFLTLLFAGLVLTGCEGCSSIQPGADPVVVNAERTINVAVDTFDSFVKIEREQDAYLRGINPGIHTFAEKVRADALTDWIPTARRLKDAYKSNRTAENKANLVTYLATLQQLINEAQKYLTQAKP